MTAGMDRDNCQTRRMASVVVCNFCLLFVLHMSTGVLAEVQPQCPVYVSEGGMLSCTCIYTAEYPPTLQPQFAWLNHSTSPLLTIPKVHRSLNGTQYTCLMTLDDVNSTVVYTLQVAYGPDDNSVSVLPPPPLFLNDSHLVTLTCNVTEVNPEPSYEWSGVACDNGNQGKTCTFTPSLPDDLNTVVTCRAFNKYIIPGGQAATASFTLDINYPPKDPPEIQDIAPGRELSTGDNLTCTVEGGRPVVDLVLFYCINPNLPDQPDLVNATSVSSVVTVEVTSATTDVMTCLCSAVWNPDPHLYTDNFAVVNVTLNYTAPSVTTTPTSATSTTTTTTSARPTPETTATTTTTSTTTTTQKTSTAETETTGMTTDDGTTEGEGSTSHVPPTTPSVITTTSKANVTDDVMDDVNEGVKFNVAALAGGLAGGFAFVLVLIVIVVICKRKRERDVTLMATNHFADGCYKRSSKVPSPDDLYGLDNSGYDKREMEEDPNPFMTPAETPPASHSTGSARYLELQRALGFYHSIPDSSGQLRHSQTADNSLPLTADSRNGVTH